MTRDVSHGRALVHGGHNNQQRGSAGTFYLDKGTSMGINTTPPRRRGDRPTRHNRHEKHKPTHVARHRYQSLRKPYPVPAEADDGDLAPSLILV
uniref:Uncharacterized protein n=1 Tax=Oryza barthii TaxID=65489 RepID=A0A0D3F3G0_9ORYZ